MVSSYMFLRGEKMNNKIFLNKEAGFLAHTKRKRRFAVTLVGVFFMLLACAGAIGFGQVAYAADERTVPNFKSPDPDYPWYGYDAYTGAFLRYHDLRVNLNGSRSYQVYCFNIKKNYPRPFTSSDKKWYKRLEGTAETFKVHAMAPRVGGEELTKKLRSVMYNGYPNDGNNIMKGLEPSNAIEVTQYAVWYYSDKSQYEIETLWKSEAKEGKISESQVTLMREALRKLISSDEDLVKQVPSNFKLSTFESSDKSYQNLLSAEFVPDDPPKPGDTSEHNPKTPELDGSPIPEDPKHPDDNLEPTLPPVMLDGEEVPEKPSVDLPIEVPRYEFNNKDQSPLAGESGETEYITEVYGNQQNPVDIDKKLPNETGFSGNMVETEDTKEPGVLMGGQSESVEFTKDTQTGMSGFSETVTIVEDTRPKLVFHFDNNEPKVEENREKPTKNIAPILPATGDIGNVLAFLGILILSVLSIFSLLKNKQNNKV
ncbi:fibronectin-binding protein PrtF1/SfbI [Streptococcus pyogenes]|uniref:fibronectin-binding protein PrtF1/SfbI n=1 Tax=Streptococcus pyogenes TaxID=1314 RepID=UPI0018824252|nr:fibronectin-binding protein PrtF1/SfbI [Streptococcus pyogenes]